MRLLVFVCVAPSKVSVLRQSLPSGALNTPRTRVKSSGAGSLPSTGSKAERMLRGGAAAAALQAQGAHKGRKPAREEKDTRFLSPRMAFPGCRTRRGRADLESHGATMASTKWTAKAGARERMNERVTHTEKSRPEASQHPARFSISSVSLYLLSVNFLLKPVVLNLNAQPARAC